MTKMKMGEAGKEVNLGILGLGGRGTGQTMLLASMPDVHIRAVFDPYPDRVENALKKLNDAVS